MDPYLWLTDPDSDPTLDLDPTLDSDQTPDLDSDQTPDLAPDPGIFVIDLQDKKLQNYYWAPYFVTYFIRGTEQFFKNM
jgi:hypothetical protein